jgi:FkbM family methyltransferase
MYYYHKLRKFSENDEPDFKVIKYLISPGDHVVDIGANIGWYSVFLSRLVEHQGKVYSFEPVPLTFELLAFSIKKLKLNNVKLFDCAISDVDGSKTIQVPKWAYGGDNFYQARIVDREMIKPQLTHYSVQTKSLFSIFSHSPKPLSFIKCDVEGHELSVVKGAGKLLGQFKPQWLVEVSDDPENTESQAWKMFELFKNEGYSAWWFDTKKLRKRLPGDKSTNYFFFTDSHISSIVRKGYLLY